MSPHGHVRVTATQMWSEQIELSLNLSVHTGSTSRLHRRGDRRTHACIYIEMIRKLKSGQFRLYSREKDASTGKRRNLGTFSTLEKARQHEREIQYFKRH
jgi:hypothetical protein